MKPRRLLLTLTTALLLLSATLVSAQSVTLNLPPTQDAFIRLDSVTWGASASLSVYTWPTGKIADVSLLTFSLAAIPAGATIQSATLTLTLTAVDAGTEPTYAVALHKVLVPTNVALASGTSSGVAPWTLNTTCCGLANIPLAQSDIGPVVATAQINRAVGGGAVWDATSIVQEWLATPSANFGLLLNADATKPADRFRTFASSEAATGRPVLRVVYATGPPQSDLLPTSRLGWEYDGATLAAVQANTYSAYVDAIKRGLAHTCVATVPPSATTFSCSALAPASALVVGTHTIDATATVAGVESAHSDSITVVQLPATVSPTTTTLVMTGQPASPTFTATVASAGGVPTGTLTFKDNGAVQATRTVSATGTGVWAATLAAGAHLVTAEYGGAPTFGASVSTGVTVTVVATPVTPSGLRILR